VSELKNQIEAVLFAAGKKVTFEDLARLCNIDVSSVKAEAVILKKDYEQRDSPLILSEESDGWKMTVREKYLSLVHKMLPETELSKSVLETLAVIAWRHPAMQSDIIKIRTNKAYDHIDELIERGFISKERKGRSYLIRITPKFNEYFELPNNEAIKKIFEDIQKHIKLEETEEGGSEKKIELETYDEAEGQEPIEVVEETEEEPEEKEIKEKAAEIKEEIEAVSETFEEEPEEPEEETEEKEVKKEEPKEKKQEKRRLSDELEKLAGDEEEEEAK
jgi:segregation and condensation protein B